MRKRKMTISTTITEEEIRDRLLREHLVDIRVIEQDSDPIPEGIHWRITRGNGGTGGYLIETWQDRLPSQRIPLLSPPEEV